MNSTTLQLTWALPAREKRNGIIRQYLINATALESGDHFQWMSPTTSLIVSGLHPHYHYNLIIAAITIGPSGPFSDVHSVLMPEDGKMQFFLLRYGFIVNKFNLKQFLNPF